jgi:hypothetical protein
MREWMSTGRRVLEHAEVETDRGGNAAPLCQLNERSLQAIWGVADIIVRQRAARCPFPLITMRSRDEIWSHKVSNGDSEEPVTASPVNVIPPHAAKELTH